MKKIYVFVEHNGFVMGFEKSGSTLKYTLDLREAQDFELVSQAKFVIKANGLSSDFCKIMEIV
jgi:hypothetical protein